jgi:hypothetical protein
MPIILYGSCSYLFHKQCIWPIWRLFGKCPCDANYEKSSHAICRICVIFFLMSSHLVAVVFLVHSFVQIIYTFNAHINLLIMRVAGFFSSLHRTPACTCSHIPHPTQLSPASLILCCQLVHGRRPSCWKLVWLFQHLQQFVHFFACRVAQHHPWLGHSFFMSYCVAYSFDLLDFRCNTEPLNCTSDIMLTRHHCSRYTMQSSFIPASIMRACGAHIGSRTIVFNYHYRYRLFLSC